MYSGRTDAVPIPKDLHGGKLITLKNGYIYYFTESKWNNELKRPIDNRVCIGKIDPDHEGMMFPGKAFSSFFNTNQKSKTTTAKPLSPLSRSEAGTVDLIRSYGSYIVLKRSAEQIGLLAALDQTFPSHSKEIIALAIHAIMDHYSTSYNFSNWAFDNYCGLNKSLSNEDINEIYAEFARSPYNIKLFFENFRKEFSNKFPNSSKNIVAFDTLDHNKDHNTQAQIKEILPSISTAMFVDETTGISLWYEHFATVAFDQNQSPFSLNKVKDLGYQKLFVMFDRDYYSETNANSINEQELEMIMMMPQNQKLVNETIALWRDIIFLNEFYYINEANIYGVQTKVKLSNNKECYAYVYYDESTAVEERNAIQGKINFYMNEAKSQSEYTEQMQNYFAQRGIVVTPIDQEKNFSLSIDPLMFQQACSNVGFFMILSNRCMSAKDLLYIIKRRDFTQKAFTDLKSHFGLSETYTYNGATYESKLFFAFISLIMMQAFSWYEQKLLHAFSSDTADSLLAEMRRYKIQNNKDGSWLPIYSMNDKQRTIIEALELSESAIEKTIKSI